MSVSVWVSVILALTACPEAEAGFALKAGKIFTSADFDGYRTAPLAADRGVFVIVGPREFHFDRDERQILGCASEYYRGGVRRLGINTDAPVVPEESLSMQATMAAHFGLPDVVALKGLTIVAAQALCIEDRVGSLEVGKDADVGVWTGSPIDPRSRCLRLYVNGQVAYDVERDDGRY